MSKGIEKLKNLRTILKHAKVDKKFIKDFIFYILFLHFGIKSHTQFFLKFLRWIQKLVFSILVKRLQTKNMSAFVEVIFQTEFLNLCSSLYS